MRTGGRDDRLYELAGRLTERDRRICRLLYEHRVLTTGQVTDVAFDSARKAQARLAMLHALGVVERFRFRSWSGTSPYHLTLGRAGAAVVAAERAVSVADLGWHKQTATALATNRQLAHLVGCNGIFTRLIRSARARPGCALDEWWSARRCAGAWGDAVRPDAYAVWVEDDVRLPFCFEYDTGTEALRRLAAKLDGYARLARAVGHPTWV
ncbi:MAG: replication-relaxation family protein, partial [Acidimicrobiales bacterium]